MNNIGKKTYLLLSFLILASLSVRIPGILESFWFDEIFRTHLKLGKDSISGLLFHDVHNFLYNGFMYFWINIFQDSEFSIRIPSIIFGYFSAIIFSYWVANRFGLKTAALVLVWILFSPFHIWYSTEAKNNMMVLFFMTLIFVSYSNLLKDRQWKWAIISFITGVLGVFTDFLLLFPLVAALATSTIALKKLFSKDLLVKLTTTFASTALFVTPLIIYKMKHQGEMIRDYLKPLNLEELFLFLFNFLSNGNAILNLHFFKGLDSVQGLHIWGFLIIMAIVLIIPFLNGLYSLRESNDGIFANLTFLTPVSIIFCLSWYLQSKHSGGPQVYLERSLASIVFYLYPFVLFYGALKMRSKKFQWGFIAAIFLLNLVGTGLMLTYHKDRWSIWLPNPDWRSFAEDIRKDVDETFVFTNCKPLAIQYYLRDTTTRSRALQVSPYISPEELKNYISNELGIERAASPRSFYIAINKYWDTSPARFLNRKLIPRIYSLVEKKHYFCLYVYKYRYYDIKDK